MINSIRIGQKVISSRSNKVFVIAEAGVSHFGSLKKGRKLIDLAVSAKADAVKFQSYITEELVHYKFKKWFDRLKLKEVNFNFIKSLKKYADKKGIIFLCTPHTETAVDWLKSLNLVAYKIGSGEIGNFEFLKKIIKLRKPMIVSTGMHSTKELKKLKLFFSKEKYKKVIFLKCNSQYPTPDREINLKSFVTFKKIFKNNLVGYSDHTNHDLAIIGSITYGARVVEKHISLDFNVKNAQDWKVSFNKKGLEEMVKTIRKIEEILGLDEIKVSSNEKKSKIWATKSIFAKRKIYPGEKISLKNVKFQRPGNFLNCSEFNKINNRKVSKLIKTNQAIKLNDF
mgnify:CR=1 FL=1